MMWKINLAALFLLFFFANCSNESVPDSPQSKENPCAKDPDCLMEALYNNAKSIFDKIEYYNDEEEISFFPWEDPEKPDASTIEAGLQYLAEKAEVTHGFLKSSLMLEVNLPFELWDSDHLYWKIISQNLSADGQKLEASSQRAHSFITAQSQTTGNIFLTLDREVESVDGEIELEVMISPLNESVFVEGIGARFELNGIDYKIVDVIGDQVVLECDKYAKERYSFQYLNVSSDKRTAYVRFKDHAKRRELTKAAGGKARFGSHRFTAVSQKTYDLFKDNPAISLESFKTEMLPAVTAGIEKNQKANFIAEIVDSPCLIVLRNPGKVQTLAIYSIAPTKKVRFTKTITN